MIKKLMSALQTDWSREFPGLEFCIDDFRLLLCVDGKCLGCWRQAEDLTTPLSTDAVVFEDGEGNVKVSKSVNEAVAHFIEVVLPEIRVSFH